MESRPAYSSLFKRWGTFVVVPMIFDPEDDPEDTQAERDYWESPEGRKAIDQALDHSKAPLPTDWPLS